MPDSTTAVTNVLQAARRLLGIRVSLKDLTGYSQLASDLQWHSDAACKSHVQAINESSVCHQHCTVDLPQTLQQQGGRQARLVTCPFHHTELVVPVFQGDLIAGILYAGPLWLKKTEPPHPGLTVRPNQAWIEDRLIILESLARDIGRLWERPTPHRQASLTAVVDYIDQHLRRSIGLQELAQFLQLSPSRTGHLIKEQFNLTVPQLITRQRLSRAARMLAEGDTSITIANIGQSVGIDDQGYFTRVFKKTYGITPSQYRQRWHNKI